MDSTFPSSSQPHVLAIPFPAQGHINPLMRICKVLASRGLLITFVNVDAIHHRISASERQHDDPQPPPPLHETQLPRIRRAHVPAPGLDISNDFRLSFEDAMKAVDEVGVAVEQLIERLSNEGPPVTCLISDVFTSRWAQNVADKFRIPRIAMFPSSQSYNLLCFYLSNGKIDMTEAVRARMKQDMPADRLFCEALPGLPALRVADLPKYSHLTDETEALYPRVVHDCAIAYEKAHAIILNSFDELEGPCFETLRMNIRPQVYPLGPLVEELADETSTSLWKEEDDCIQWLQDQPPHSVLYISFGSMSLISKLQFEEILIGLEASNQRFLWAFRSGLVKDAAYSSVPDDFIARTKDRGHVVGWVPQLRVLSHASIGGFLTHCGWNSTMEGIASGVPMLCWPFIADQFLDAKYIVEEWKVGLRFVAEKGGLVSRVEVEKQVKELMKGEEGKTLRKNAAKLRDAGRISLQEGGSSHLYTEALVQALSCH